MSLFPENASGMAIAGVCGAVVYGLSNNLTWKNTLVCLVIGAISAVYLTPVITPLLSQIFGSDSETPGFLGGYVCGMGGIALNLILIDILKGRLRSFQIEEELEKEKSNEQK